MECWIESAFFYYVLSHSSSAIEHARVWGELYHWRYNAVRQWSHSYVFTQLALLCSPNVRALERSEHTPKREARAGWLGLKCCPEFS